MYIVFIKSHAYLIKNEKTFQTTVNLRDQFLHKLEAKYKEQDGQCMYKRNKLCSHNQWCHRKAVFHIMSVRL